MKKLLIIATALLGLALLGVVPLLRAPATAQETVSLSCGSDVATDGSTKTGYNIFVSVNAPDTIDYTLSGSTPSQPQIGPQQLIGGFNANYFVDREDIPAPGSYTYSFDTFAGPGGSSNCGGSLEGIDSPPSCAGEMSLNFSDIYVGDTAGVTMEGLIGGTFVSDNESVATVQTQGNSGTITGVGPGSARISGQGWDRSVDAFGNVFIFPGSCEVPDVIINVMVNQVPTPASCPDSNNYTVSLSESTIGVGDTTQAYAPNNYSDGSFGSSDESVAAVSDSDVTGTASGEVNIFGFKWNWTAPNGAIATGCDLGGSYLSVVQPVDMKVNGTDGPITIPYNSSATLTWTTTNASSCTATGDWSGSKSLNNISPGQTTGSLTTPGTYTLECSGVAGPVSDSVTVNTTVAPPPPPSAQPAASVATNVYNTETGQTAGLTVACGRVLLRWTAIVPTSLVDGYRIYYEQNPGQFVLLFTATPQMPNPNTYEQKELDPPTLSGLYRYAVSSYKGAEESAQTLAVGSPIAATWPCTTNLSSSNTDLVSVNNTSLPADLFAVNEANIDIDIAPLSNIDKLTFAINLVNSGQQPYTQTMTVVDTMTRLTRPPNGFNASVACSGKCTMPTPVYYAAAGTLTFTVTPKSGQSLNPGEVWTIKFTALPQAPTGTTVIFRLQHQVSINGFSSIWLRSPLLLILKDLPAPNFQEGPDVKLILE